MKSLVGDLMPRHSQRLQYKWAALVAVVSAVAIAASLVVAPSSPAAAQAGPGNQFTQMGMHIPQAKDGVWPDVPIGSIRLWDTGVSWREINTAPGVYDWSTLDRVVALAKSKGASVLYVFGNTPAWAAEPGCLEAQGAAIKGAGANCPPADLKTFSTFAGEIAKKYGTDIESYELWNEGNIGTFWRGSVQQLFEMTNEGAKVIKSANPKALIASVSVTTRLDTSGYRFLPEYVALLTGANWPIDAFAIHSYPAGSFSPCGWGIRSGQDYISCEPSLAESGAQGGWQSAMVHLLEREFALIVFRNDLYNKFQMPKKIEIWDTELNYGLAGPAGIRAQQFSESEQVTLINYSYLQSAKQRIARTYWFAWGPKDLAGVVQFGVTTDFGTKTAQAFAQYWNWAQAGLMKPVGPLYWSLDATDKASAAIQFLATGAYASIKPTPGTSIASARTRWVWPAVGPCIKVDANTAIPTEVVALSPFLRADVPMPGC
jgi:hypothetical protein